MKKTILFFITAFVAASLFVACGPVADDGFEKQTEKNIADSLRKEVDSMLYLIDIDADEINERKSEMDSILRILKFGVDSMPDEQAKQDVIYYYGISRTYKSFLKEYAEIVKEAEVVFNRLNTLRNSVEANEYQGKKDKFKEHRNQIETQIKEIIAKANLHISTVHNVEAGYQRVDVQIAKLMKRITLKN